MKTMEGVEGIILSPDEYEKIQDKMELLKALQGEAEVAGTVVMERLHWACCELAWHFIKTEDYDDFLQKGLERQTEELKEAYRRFVDDKNREYENYRRETFLEYRKRSIEFSAWHWFVCKVALLEAFALAIAVIGVFV